ncbi:MAG: FAD-binding oxidoreductase, partial [Paracoccaceae bacterium]|nr:FAD-binding oxidoreductase [Paracoccaceae bacterium]
LCLGLEVVMPDGQIWHGLSRLRKDNTGYDLKNLLIGAEGTLGIITAAALKLAPQPAQSGTALMVVKDPNAALELLSLARADVAEGINAFELIHRQGLQFLREKLPDVRQPFEADPEWMVLIDLGLGRGGDPATALMDLFEAAQSDGLVSDGVIARSETQRDDLWALRERIPEANRLIGAVSNHDISLPLSAVPEFIRRGHEVVANVGAFRINCFGHLGDGNMHYNIYPILGQNLADHLAERDDLKRAIHDLVHDMQGSISAEHGIGRLKVDDLERYADPVKLSVMRAIKQALDPIGIMNPGVILRLTDT